MTLRPATRLLALAGAAALVLAECTSQPPPTSPETIARIEEQEIKASELDAYFETNLGDDAASLDSDVLSKLLDQFVEEMLLVRLARERGLIADGASRIRAISALLQSAAKAEPLASEVEAYYRAHGEEFERPERVRLRQILVEDRTAAEEALTELRAGGDFAAVAKRYSRDPSAESGGNQGLLAREDLPLAFSEPIFSLAPGQVSDIVVADYGFHIFQVEERLPAARAPLEEVETEIHERLERDRSDRLIRQLVEEARSRYTVSVYDRNLPFNYQGTYRENES